MLMLDVCVKEKSRRGRQRTSYIDDVKRGTAHGIKTLVLERTSLKYGQLPTNLQVEEKKEIVITLDQRQV